MQLNREQIKEVQEALLSGYDEDSLRMMVRVELGEELAAIAKGSTLKILVFNLIEWAERSGRIFELIDGAHADLPGNAGIQQVWEASQAWRKPAAVSAPSTAKPPVEFDWVTVRAGVFLMGSDKEKDKFAYDDELPQHQVNLPVFRIARVPVTNAQYEKFVDATGYATPDHWQHGRIPPGKENHPVVYVSWHDARAFCQWAGVRLPTEAEWEKAARGTDGRIYPWGNEPPDENRCNFNKNVGDTTPVGKYPKGASPYGVLDMAGNVWEWTSSKYQSYPYKADDGRESPEGSDLRTLRGGSFLNSPRLTTCAAPSGSASTLITCTATSAFGL